MAYRTLVVAPRTNLVLADEEINAVVNALGANLLQGIVTANMVLDKLTQGWDIVWFMTHGTPEGILLSDGPLNASTLTTFVRTADARLVVLNTCESIGVALDIHNELLTNLVCTLREVPDREAFFTGKQLALQLARGKTFSQAYLAAKPGQNTNYIFLVGKDRDMQSAVLNAIPVPPPTPEGNKNQNVADYIDSIRRLDAIVSGDMLWGQEGLVNTVRTMLTEISKLKQAILLLQIGGGVLIFITFIILITVFNIFLAGR